MAALAVSFVGDSGAGKTTLLERVIEELAREGVRIAALKHSSGFADPDPPGKDSARLRRAGAARVVLASADRTVVFLDHPGAEPPPPQRLAWLADADLVLVESYREADLPCVEVLRSALPRRSPRLAGDPRLVAVAADFAPEGVPTGCAVFPLEPAAPLAGFVRRLLERHRSRG